MAGSRLSARPSAAPTTTPPSGTTELGGGALLRVPPAAAAGAACPLLVMFHGAGSSATAGLALVDEQAGVVVLAPQSAGRTWDVIERRAFGVDVARVDQALASVFATCPVDPARIAFGGFSDGASYALSLGLDNGDLARHLVAFSPGFLAPADPRGRPRIFVSHGVDDPVLPIDRCSRRLVPRLQAAGYDVTYAEFDGGHVVTPELGRRALAWLGAG